MKKMLVKENIGFKRGQDSKKSLGVGDNSPHVRKQKLAYIKRKLVKDVTFSDNAFVSGYSEEGSDEEYVLKNINQYIQVLERLHEAGVTKNRIKIYGKQFNIRPIQGIHGNTVVAGFLTKEDAEKWVEFSKKYASLNRFPSKVGGLAQMGIYYGLDEISVALDNRFEDELS